MIHSMLTFVEYGISDCSETPDKLTEVAGDGS